MFSKNVEKTLVDLLEDAAINAGWTLAKRNLCPVERGLLFILLIIPAWRRDFLADVQEGSDSVKKALLKAWYDEYQLRKSRKEPPEIILEDLFARAKSSQSDDILKFLNV